MLTLQFLLCAATGTQFYSPECPPDWATQTGLVTAICIGLHSHTEHVNFPKCMGPAWKKKFPTTGN